VEQAAYNKARADYDKKRVAFTKACVDHKTALQGDEAAHDAAQRKLVSDFYAAQKRVSRSHRSSFWLFRDLGLWVENIGHGDDVELAIKQFVFRRKRQQEQMKREVEGFESMANCAHRSRAPSRTRGCRCRLSRR